MMLDATVMPRAAGDDATQVAPQAIRAIGFLQLCGITNKVDRNWRRLLS